MDVDFIKKLNDLAKNLRQHDINMSSNEAINKASKMLRTNDSFNEMKQNSSSSFNETVAKRFNISSKIEKDEDNIKDLNKRIEADKNNLNDFFSKVDYELKKLEPKKNIINYLLFNDLRKINPNLNKKPIQKLEVKKELEASIPMNNNNNNNNNSIQQQNNNIASSQNTNQAKKTNSVDLFNFFSKGDATPNKPQNNTNNFQQKPVNNNAEKNNTTKKKGSVDLFDFFNKK